MSQYYSPIETPPPSSWVAGNPWEEAFGSGIQALGRGAGAYAGAKKTESDMKERVRLARQLRDGLMAKGIPQGIADSAALEYVKAGTTILLAAVNDLDKTAADVMAKKGVAEKDIGQGKLYTAQAVEEPANALSKRGLETAQTADIPLAAADRATTAGAAVTRAGADVTTAGVAASRAETERMDVKAKIGQETLKWARKHDVNASGTIDPEERVKMLRAERLAVQKEVQQEIQKAKTDPLEADPELMGMTDAEKEDLAISRVDEQIEAYEFSVRAVGRLGQKRYYGTGLNAGKVVQPDEPSDDSKMANTYEEAVAKINQFITDPVQKQRALEAAKAYFKVP